MNRHLHCYVRKNTHKGYPDVFQQTKMNLKFTYSRSLLSRQTSRSRLTILALKNHIFFHTKTLRTFTSFRIRSDCTQAECVTCNRLPNELNQVCDCLIGTMKDRQHAHKNLLCQKLPTQTPFVKHFLSELAEQELAIVQFSSVISQNDVK